MRVKMLEDAPGSPDGVTVNEYDEGVVYEVSDALGVVFVREGFADETDEDVTSDVVSESVADEDADAEADAGGKTSTPAENK